MYEKTSNGWLKHWDFILLDFICLQLTYVFSCIVRNGMYNPYADEVYLNIGLIICMADICSVFFLEGYKGIMRRDGIQELKAVLKHVITICIFETMYLFLSRNSYGFSRIAFLIFLVSSVCILYAERMLWKTYLLKHKKKI